ncbi:hypothetical protein DM02DRAFT_596380 [Periconia macrospinosa]|uniref:DUF6536 domain-containing protein n=1 Tax=Periconia macrospinosa TaxID=97972 RepID=A0A2V1DKN1_9PLEO|nr:hypothetical protein DM02DRAFT_596380 [Periconia macrospinosa]
MLKFDKILPAGLKSPYASLDEFSHKRPKRQYLQGWRFGAVNCAISASVVFFINLVVTIVCSTYRDKNQRSLYVGDCEKTRQINSGLHILINILSTVLLSSSNYCMQCLSAPTRGDVDAAHGRGKWLDIGVLSLRNLRSINRKRVMIWALLGLSSLPLHLLYNSAVYMSIASFEYYAAAVGQSFIDNPNCDGCTDVYDSTHWNSTSRSLYPNATNEKVRDLRQKAREGRLKRLENLDCINTYAKMIQSTFGSVLLVVQDKDVPSQNPKSMQENSSVFWDSFNYNAQGSIDMEPYKWICSSFATNRSSPDCTKNIGKVRASPVDWTVKIPCLIGQRDDECENTGSHMKGPIQYCLAEEVEPVCRIQWSMPIAIVVVILNFFKAALIFYTAFGIKEEPLMAIGDAVTSFLESPDTTTRNMCLSSKKNIAALGGKFNAGPRRWGEENFSWRHAASRKRRFFSFSLMLITIAIIGHLLSLAVASLDGDSKDLASIARLGFGAIDPRTMLKIDVGGVIANTLLANIAQVIISIVYFTYNSLFTSMLLGYEWSTYAHKRKGLRVTHPARGAQRSTYFLSLPYRFGLPLMAISGLMHWLVSQCIFFVSIDVQKLWINTVETTQTCGYSPIAMITGLIVGIVMIAVAFGIGYIPHKPGTNLAGSCSAAMSAACHPLPSQKTGVEDLMYKKLQWGVVSEPSANDGVGHCSFSDGPVQMPQKGERYAGS